MPDFEERKTNCFTPGNLVLLESMKSLRVSLLFSVARAYQSSRRISSSRPAVVTVNKANLG